MATKLGPDQEAAIQIVAGYCRPEIVAMVMEHEQTCIVHKAAVEFLALCGLTFPAFLAEWAEYGRG